MGYLGNKFGVRVITSFGALLGAIGVGLCFFAEKIELVIFLYGTIFGMYKTPINRNKSFFFGDYCIF